MDFCYRDIQQIKNALTLEGAFKHKQLNDDECRITACYDFNDCTLQEDIKIGEKQFNLIGYFENDDETILKINIYEMTYNPNLPEGPTEEDEFAHIGISMSKDGTYFLEEPCSKVILNDAGEYKIEMDEIIAIAVIEELNQRRIVVNNRIIKKYGWKVYDE